MIHSEIFPIHSEELYVPEATSSRYAITDLSRWSIGILFHIPPEEYSLLFECIDQIEFSHRIIDHCRAIAEFYVIVVSDNSSHSIFISERIRCIIILIPIVVRELDSVLTKSLQASGIVDIGIASVIERVIIRQTSTRSHE